MKIYNLDALSGSTFLNTYGRNNSTVLMVIGAIKNIFFSAELRNLLDIDFF